MTENTNSPAYKLTVRAIRDLIEDDTYACTFQSLGHYRGALQRHRGFFVASALKRSTKAPLYTP